MLLVLRARDVRREAGRLLPVPVPEVRPVPARLGDEPRCLHLRVRCRSQRRGAELDPRVRDLLRPPDARVDPGHVPHRAACAVPAVGTDQASECVSLAFVEQFALPLFGWIGGHHFVALLAS